MIIRVKEVIRITMDGTIASTVIRTTIWRDSPYSEPSAFDVRRVRAGPVLANTSDVANSKKRQRPGKRPIPARGL